MCFCEQLVRRNKTGYTTLGTELVTPHKLFVTFTALCNVRLEICWNRSSLLTVAISVVFVTDLYRQRLKFFMDTLGKDHFRTTRLTPCLMVSCDIHLFADGANWETLVTFLSMARFNYDRTICHFHTSIYLHLLTHYSPTSVRFTHCMLLL